MPYIPVSAFENCISLRDFVWDGYYASGETYTIKDRAFANAGKLERMTLTSPVKIELEGDPFAGMAPGERKLFVPEELLEDYKADSGYAIFTVLPLEAGVDAVGLQSDICEYDYYDLSGTRVGRDAGGVIIRVDRCNGTTGKMIRR